MVFLAGKGENEVKIFSMYSGLKREIYILCFGRFVTAMGSLIWPMLTLILKSKLGYDAEQVALWFLIFGIVQIPLGLIGGKLTDRYNKRNLILVFDLISVSLYVITAFLPLSTFSICIYYLGSLFQHMEWPAYDALIAELTKDHDREKAYSLQYLAANLGVVFAPTLGGLLFNNYLWLSFLIAGGAVFSSTMLIYRFVPKNTEKVENDNTYEKHTDGNLWDVIKKRKLLIGYLIINCMVSIVYAQFNYMLPMQMDDIFGVKGAVYFWNDDQCEWRCGNSIHTDSDTAHFEVERHSAHTAGNIFGSCWSMLVCVLRKKSSPLFLRNGLIHFGRSVTYYWT